MKSIFFMLFVASFSLEVVALECEKGTTLKTSQTPETTRKFCVDSKGKKQGRAQTLSAKGEVISEVHFKDGKLHGDWKRYWHEDDLRDQGEWISGKPTGAWSRYDQDGDLTNYNVIRCGKAQSIYARDKTLSMASYDSESCGWGIFKNFQIGFLHMDQSSEDYVHSVYFKISPLQYHLFWKFYTELYIAAAPIMIGEDELSLTMDLGGHFFVVLGRHSFKYLAGAQKWIVDDVYFKQGLEYEYLFPWLDKFSPMSFARLRGLYLEASDVDIPNAEAFSISVGAKFDY